MLKCDQVEEVLFVFNEMMWYDMQDGTDTTDSTRGTH